MLQWLLTLICCVLVSIFSRSALASVSSLPELTAPQSEARPVLLAKKKAGKGHKGKSHKSKASGSKAGENWSATGSRPYASIEANPLGLVFGVANAEVNFKISDKMTVGPEGSFFSAGGLSGYGFGGVGYYYLDKLFEGMFIEAGAGYSVVSFDFLGISVSASGIGVHGIFGYKWLWPSFIMAVGGGLQYYSMSITSSVDSDETPSVPINGAGLALLFNIGYPLR